jgi:DNA-binding MarR family transcriptional regulator
MRSADCLHRGMQLRLKPAGLTATQYNVLRILRGARPNGLTCSTIGQRMITAEPDITRLLARLKAQKLVRQQRDPRDRRVVWTHITPPGLEVLAKLDGVVAKAPQELLKELSREEVQELIRLLKKARCCYGRDVNSGAQRAENSGNEKASPSGKPPLPQPTRLHPRPE